MPTSTRAGPTRSLAASRMPSSGRKLEQRRGLGGTLPVEVVADACPRRGSVGEEIDTVPRLVLISGAPGSGKSTLRA
ncbi:MAG: hypothetical protein ACRDRO_08475 [Pseudonocardiaceae bacterium]